jgi:hypothetical protein
MYWAVERATDAYIDHGVGAVPVASVGRRVFPSESTTFTLTARGPGGTRTAVARITVNAAGRPTPPTAAPEITFWADPDHVERGQSSTVHWMVGNATDAYIDQGVGTVAAEGSRRVFRWDSTIYTLTATGPGGTRTATASVAVGTGGIASAASIKVVPLQGGHLGRFYYQALQGNGQLAGGNQAWFVPSGSLPDGLHLDGANGLISGTPTRVGDWAFTVRATNESAAATAAFSIRIDPAQ